MLCNIKITAHVLREFGRMGACDNGRMRSRVHMWRYLLTFQQESAHRKTRARTRDLIWTAER